MSRKVVKYNPSFLSDQELIDSFVVRYSQLDQVMEVIRENDQGPNQHLLVLGPRGSGKTTLLRRVVAEVRQNEELNSEWFPVPYGEESYEVSSAGEFWLEAFQYLESLTGNSSWGKAYDELLGEMDEERLRQRCLGRLLDFADKEGKRLLFVVENLNIVLGDQLQKDDAWALRETLMHESRIMLLGSATNQFDEIIKHDQAMFELFRLIEFQRLTVSECQKIWHRVSGQEITLDQARATQILTGGNPRLLTILAVFGTNRSFSSLMDDLALLVDEHTDYFKSNFEELPPKERKVFACLATLWEDSLASDIARAARMSTNQVSALLKRLESRGIVKDAGREGRRKKYQLAERLYNIYYLMRRGQSRGRVKAVVHFMRQFYGQERLHEAVGVIAREACCIAEGQRQEHYRAISMMCNFPEASERLDKLRDVLPKDFWELSDLPEDVKMLVFRGVDEEQGTLERSLSKVSYLFQEERWEEFVSLTQEILDDSLSSSKMWLVLAEVYYNKLSCPEESEKCLRKVLKVSPKDAPTWGKLGVILVHDLEQPEEGEKCLRRAVEIAPENVLGWISLENAMFKFNRLDEGISCLRKIVKLSPEDSLAWGRLGEKLALKEGQEAESLECLRKCVKLAPSDARGWAALGTMLIRIGELEEAEKTLRKVVKLDPLYARGWQVLGGFLNSELHLFDEGMQCLRKAVELDPDEAINWGVLGVALINRLGEMEEGERCLRKAVEIAPQDARGWGSLGNALAFNLGKPEEGADCWRKVLELHPNSSDAWRSLGEVLSLKLGQLHKGIECLHKAVDCDPENAWSLTALGCTLLFDLNEIEEGSDFLQKAIELDADILNSYGISEVIEKDIASMEALEVALNCANRSSFLLTRFANAFIAAKRYDVLNIVETWVREALEKDAESVDTNRAFSIILALHGNIHESLRSIKIVLEQPEVVYTGIHEITDVLTIAAALGNGIDALDVLLSSQSVEKLEPIVVGLKQYLGLDYQAPQEVKEIGEDIVKKIEYWKEWHANREA